MIKKITIVSLMVLLSSMINLNKLKAQAGLANATPSVLINFSNSMPTNVGSNPSTAFAAAGFSPNTTTAGRLNSNAWAVTGMSDGNLAFGGTSISGDLARGAISGDPSTGGMYAFTGSPGSVANPFLIVQPAGSDFNSNGTITLRIVNNGTTAINSFTISYNLLVRNNEGRSSSFNFSHSTNNTAYTAVSALDYTSPTTADALGWIQATKQTVVNSLSIAPGSFFYIRWTGNDVGGSGSRDEFGLDDISINADFEKVTKLSTGFCGGTATSLSQFIWADSLGTPSVSNNWRYRFKLINGASTYSYQTVNEWPIVTFNVLPGTSLNTTYTASVAWSSDFGSTFSAYGPTCTLTSPSVPTSSMLPAYCSYTPTSFTQLMTAETAGGATSYKFKLENAALSYSQTFTNVNANVNLAQYSNLISGTTYSISVSVQYNSSYGPYGNVCQVTVPSAPTSSMLPAYCSYTPSSYSQLMTAETAGGATSYKFKLENAALSYSQTFTNVNANVNLAQYTGLTAGTTYSLSVSVQYNSVFGPYGNVCQVTAPTSAPTTSVVSANCSYTPASYSQLMNVNVVSGAQGYEYKLENASLSYVQTFTNVNQNFNFAVYTGLSTNTTYTVSARVKFMNTWGAYGATCTVHTPTSSSMPLFENTIPTARIGDLSIDNENRKTDLDAMIYPNPYTESFAINLNSYNVNEKVSVNIFDINGRLIEEHSLMPSELSSITFGSAYLPGIYNITIVQGLSTKSLRVIKP